MPSASSWSLHYLAGMTGWDLGGPHPWVSDLLGVEGSLLEGPPGRAFVPGSGAGHDAIAFARAGWDVVAVDVASVLEDRVGERLRSHGIAFSVADALAWDDARGFDLVFDHTFFCALEPVDRPRFGEMANRLLRAGGSVVSVVFPLDRCPATTGPPYAISIEDLASALGAGFRLDLAGERGRPTGRAWDETWVRFTRPA